MKQHLLTVIIIILTVILIMLVGSIIYEEKINIDKQKSQETSIDEKNNIKDEEKKEEVSDKDIIGEDSPNEEDFIGEEEIVDNKQEQEKEQEEKQDNRDNVSTKKSNEEIVIELAKNKWGNDSTVTFSIEEEKNDIYYVAVKSNATVIAWYEVNIKTEEVSEFY